MPKSETFLFAEPEAKPTKETQETSPAQKLLDWLQRWNKPTVNAHEMMVYGPRLIRNRKSTADAAEILVKHGWLIPQKTNQSNWRRWEIVCKPTIHPHSSRVAATTGTRTVFEKSALPATNRTTVVTLGRKPIFRTK